MYNMLDDICFDQGSNPNCVVTVKLQCFYYLSLPVDLQLLFSIVLAVYSTITQNNIQD